MMQHIGLFGNPNTGKTSLFNSLTGSYEYVGNWSGVTVEKKVGVLRNEKGSLIDLPGVYSLHPLSKDEQVATQFLLTESFSSILNIVDASRLERNLHLTIELLEFGKPMTIGLNMIDVANARGHQIHVGKLGELLGVSITPMIARKGVGCEQLLNEIPATTKQNCFLIHYGTSVEKAVHEIAGMLPDQLPGTKRWYALQCLLGNETVFKEVERFIDNAKLHSIVEEATQQVKSESHTRTMKQHIHQIRASYIETLLIQAVAVTPSKTISATERIDRIATHNVLGIPIFLLIMFLLFKVTFDWVGTPISNILDDFFSGPLSQVTTFLLDRMGANTFIRNLVSNGVIAGVGGVLVFVPQIFILFFFISLLEDSGYMARVATVMDRLMEKVGLNGKAFIPMIIGLGCNVPGIMAARTVEQPKERLITILLTPLMSCSARLSVYSLFVAAFFAKQQALIVLSLYVLGIGCALLLAKFFSKVLLRDEVSFFLIELPPYRVPQWKTLLRSTWDKGKGFVRKAGTFIFGGSVFIWLLSYAGPDGLQVDMEHSYLAHIGGLLAPLFIPLGFGTWQAGAALLTGFLAKEVVVSTMTIMFKTPNIDQLHASMQQIFTPLSAYSFLVFILLYVPCLATVAVIQKETSSKKWTMFSIGYALVLAYGISFIVHTVGILLGFR